MRTCAARTSNSSRSPRRAVRCRTRALHTRADRRLSDALRKDAAAARITAAIEASKSERARTVYAHVWRQWERWCANRGIPPLPADHVALCAYLTERAEAGKATGTLDMSCTVIRHVHRLCAADDPVASEAVRQVRRGLVRTYGAAPRRPAGPLTVDEIRQIISGIDRTTSIGIRDTAIILLGYASAMRRAETVTLALSDVEPKPAGLQLKYPQVEHGSGRPRPTGRHRPRPARPHRSRRCGQRAARGPRGAPGALFTRNWASTVSLESLSGHVVARMLRARAEAAGLDDTRITAHSLRGHATAAALADVPLDRIAAQTVTKTSPSS